MIVDRKMLKLIKWISIAKLQQQQQLSNLSQVFEVGYMNQKRITPDRHMDQLSPLIPIEQYAFIKTFSL